MNLTRLYGQKSIEFHDGKLNYRTQSGFVDLPSHLVQQAINMGFTHHRPDHMAPAVDPIPDSPVAIEMSSSEPPLIEQPATQTSDLPSSHPQVAQTAEIAAREAMRAAEARMRSTVGTTP